VQAFIDRGVDFVSAETIDELVAGMNELSGERLLEPGRIQAMIEARDAELANDFGKDTQLALIRAARRYRGDRLIRTASPHRFLDVEHGPLHAVRLRILTRKTLGGVQTDLGSRALGADGTPIPGLYAAGEVAGFGGGGVHGYRSLEGTFLGGCLFSGRAAGRTAHADLG
jgi:predicted oxidoreductase